MKPQTTSETSAAVLKTQEDCVMDNTTHPQAILALKTLNTAINALSEAFYILEDTNALFTVLQRVSAADTSASQVSGVGSYLSGKHKIKLEEQIRVLEEEAHTLRGKEV